MEELQGVEGLLALQPAWKAAVEEHLSSAVPGYSRKPRQEQLKLILQQCLYSDLNLCGAGCLPARVQDMHATQLSGKFLLQLDEVVNIGAPAKARYSASTGSRCLKLLLTDGKQQISGLEYQSIPALSPVIPAGTKVLVHDAAVRRGMLLLTPASLVVLGGHVEKLQQARQRMVEHWNQPAVGRTGPPAQIHEAVQQATAVAWRVPLANSDAGQQQQQQPLAPPRVPPQQQQQQPGGIQPAGPQPALAALRPPAAAQQPRQMLQLPPPPVQAQAGAARQPPTTQQQQQQQQQQQPTGQARQSAGFVTAAQHAQPSGGVGPATNGGQSFGFVQPGGVRQHIQRLGGHWGCSGSGQQQSGGMPLQPANRVAGGAAADPNPPKRSRLQLRHAEPADFSFVQPSAQQQQPPGNSSQVQRPAPQQQQQQQGGGQGGAAGTNDDPIVIDADDEGGGPSGMQLDNPQQQQQQQAAFDPGDWSDWGDDNWDEPPPSGPQLEPYERGYDEQSGSGQAVEAVPDTEVPDGDVLEGDEWEGEGGDEEGWEDEEEWEEEGVEQQQEEGAEGGAEGMQLDDAGVEAPDASMPGAVGEGHAARGQQLESPAPSPSASLPAAHQQPAAAPPPATASVQPAPHLPQQQQQQAAGPAAEDDGQQCPEPVAVRPSRKRQVVVSDDDSDSDPIVPTAPAAPAEQQQRSSGSLQPQLMAVLSSGGPAATAAAEDAELQLAPLDEQLLKPAPSLVELLSPAPTSIPALGLGRAPAAQPGGPALAAPSRPEPPTTGPRSSLGAAPSTGPASGSRASGSGGTGAARSRLSGGMLPLQLRPTLQRGLAATPGQPRPAQLAVTPLLPRPAAQLGASALPEAAVVPGSDDDDAPVFGGLVDDTEPAAAAAAPAAGEDDSGAAAAAASEEEPFTYLYLLAQRAKSASPDNFPLTASVFALVKTMVGRMKYTNEETGEPQYGVEMVIEDGTMMCNAMLDHQFLQDFFGAAPLEFQQQLANPVTKPAATQVVAALQKHLSQFSGLMRVQLPGPGAKLVVLDLVGDLAPAQAMALQRRASS